MEERELLAYFYSHYLSKEEIVYRLPVSTSIAQFWPKALAYRKERGIQLPLTSCDGQPYWYAQTDAMLDAGDRFVALVRDDAISAMPQYAHDEGVIDEAFYSSVIEGACSTRQRARAFITEKKEPKDRSERMILNNYAALRFVLEHLDGPINEAVVLEIARILTEGTLEEGVKSGYRDAGVQVMSGTQEVIYVAPEAKYVKPMMDELLSYLAAPDVHPLIKACVAHIHLVTIHPFFDGNGRTARALSYMILLKAGYHFIRQSPISGVLAQERARYYRAIRAAQNPENGLDYTYFVEYYAQMLLRSVSDMHVHVARMQRMHALASALGDGQEAQRIVRGAQWMASEGVRCITAEKWKTKMKVSHETARKDLMRLEAEGFVSRRLAGRKVFFDLAE